MDIEDDDNNSNSSIHVNAPVISSPSMHSPHSTQIPQRSSLLSQFHQPSVVSVFLIFKYHFPRLIALYEDGFHSGNKGGHIFACVRACMRACVWADEERKDRLQWFHITFWNSGDDGVFLLVDLARSDDVNSDK